MTTLEHTWPPTDEQIRNIANSAVHNLLKSNKEELSVLVYWDNPKLMIMEPFHFAHTEYITTEFEIKGKNLKIIIGKED